VQPKACHLIYLPSRFWGEGRLSEMGTCLRICSAVVPSQFLPPLPQPFAPTGSPSLSTRRGLLTQPENSGKNESAKIPGVRQSAEKLQLFPDVPRAGWCQGLWKQRQSSCSISRCCPPGCVGSPAARGSRVAWGQKRCCTCSIQDSKQSAWVYLLLYCPFHPGPSACLQPRGTLFLVAAPPTPPAS